MTERVLRGLALTLGVVACGGEGPAPAPSVGSPAPAYEAVSLAGDSVSLARLRGKVVLLNVWATWCVPCREEIPALEKLHRRLAPSGLEVVGVSVDAAGAAGDVRSFVREYGATYPIWMDPGERVSTVFRIIGVPTTFLIGADGAILWKHVGPVRVDDEALTRVLAETLPTRKASS
ncbi:MAG: TlpA family protein disulfide reductase [Gemmatimonadota bacterium]|nr:TlpA family protein disulfide reductase [Gemmatimonadota bacterium]